MSKVTTIRKPVARPTVKFGKWLVRLQHHAISEAELIPDVTADYWRSCFDSGMSPEQAFRESFVEQDGV